MVLHIFDKVVDIDNIVFLDIDGVLNVFANPTVDFEQESIDCLNKLYDKLKYQIVLSSSWKDSYPIYYLQELFKNIGIKAPLIATTNNYFSNNENRCDSISLSDIENCDIPMIYSREHEISQWVRHYRVNHYLILDDYTMKDNELREHSICTLENGLRLCHLNEMIKILER